MRLEMEEDAGWMEPGEGSDAAAPDAGFDAFLPNVGDWVTTLWDGIEGELLGFYDEGLEYAVKTRDGKQYAIPSEFASHDGQPQVYYRGLERYYISSKGDLPRLRLEVVKCDGLYGLALRDEDGHVLTWDECTDLMAFVQEFYLRNPSIACSINTYNRKQWTKSHPAPDPLPDPRLEVLNAEGGGWVYLLESDTGHYKIGMTKHVGKRLMQFGVQLPFNVELTHQIPCEDMMAAEVSLHAHFSDKRLRGEWFSLSREDVAWIKTLAVYRDGGFLKE